MNLLIICDARRNLPKRFYHTIRFLHTNYVIASLKDKKMNNSVSPFSCLQAKLDREKKYSEDSFWLRTVNLRENFTEDKFTSLFEVQAAVNKIYNLALENDLGHDIITEWQQHVIVVQSLLDNLGSKSHKTALKDLKKVFGGTRGLNEDNRRLVDSILRNSQREEPVVQQVVQAPMYRQSPRYGPPMSFQPRPMGGVCHFCQLPGHFARECPAQRPFQFDPFRPPYGRGRGRGFDYNFPRAPFPPRRGGGRRGRG